MANKVEVLADGRLERAAPHGRGYRFAAENQRYVVGLLIDGCFVPREPPVRLEPGEILDVTAADVDQALARVQPVVRHPRLGVQVLKAFLDKTTGAPDSLSPDNRVRVIDPGVLLGDPTETVAAWMDRTYAVHKTLPHGTRPPYMRDLLLRVGSYGHVLAVGARPVGAAALNQFYIRAEAFEPVRQ